VLLPNDRAVSVGLVLTELFINAHKYAYSGTPGPLQVTLTENDGKFRLTVGDQGVGRSGGTSSGFGSRMLDSLVHQLGGTLEFKNNQPGTLAVQSAPLGAK